MSKNSASLTRKQLFQTLDSHLERVSRTFAINIRILPLGLREKIMTAYLFCRIADTFEDDAKLSPLARAELLKNYSCLFDAFDWPAQSIHHFVKNLPVLKGGSERDTELVQATELVFEFGRTFPESARKSISHWVKEMCDGMAMYALQSAEKPGDPLIHSLDDLDKYCYYVAGTVGHLLTDLFAQHSIWISVKRKEELKKFAVSFGLGLQLTNILKDFATDLTRNTVFLPDSLLQQYQIDPTTMDSPEHEKRFLALTRLLIDKTRSHLEDALSYTCLLPRMEPRLRLFCLWPLFMAAESLILILEKSREHASGGTLKITRQQVKAIVKETSLVCYSNRRLKSLFQKRITRLQSL